MQKGFFLMQISSFCRFVCILFLELFKYLFGLFHQLEVELEMDEKINQMEGN